MSDGQAASDPAAAGKQLADPNDMSTNEPTQNDAQTAQKPAEAINGFEGLYPRMTGQCWTTVLSLRNDDVSAYRVNIEQLECYGVTGEECPDNAFNQNGTPVEGYMGSHVCDHIAAAIYQAPAKPDLELQAIDGSIEMLSMAKDAAQSAQSTADSLRAARNAHAGETAAQASQNAPTDAQVQEREPAGQSADEAREKLQEAFDDATSGMDTQVHDGRVWINKTLDAPDWTFDAFLKNADQVQYDPDADSPGQYWKNYVEPGDVDDYISEVLE